MPILPLPELYHFTCDHGFAAIRRANGVLKPNEHPVFPGRSFVWLTDLPSVREEPQRVAVGLTSVALECDRTQYRFRLIHGRRLVRPFTDWLILNRIPLSALRGTLYGSGQDPTRWFVSEFALQAEYDPEEQQQQAAGSIIIAAPK